MIKIRPQTMWLNVNRQCNFRCRWCYAKGSRYQPDDDMPLDLAINLVELAYSIGIRNTLIIGGEPILWNPLLSFNKECRHLGMKTTLVTNAMRFGIDSYWMHYIQSPNDKIGVSVKAADAQQLYETTGVRNFELVRRGISRVVEYFKCGISLTYNSFYRGRLLDITRFALDCNARSMKIDFCSVVFLNNRASAKYMVKPQKIVEDVVASYPEIDRLLNSNLVFEMGLPLCIWPREFINNLVEKRRIISVCQLLKRKGLIFDTGGSMIMCNALFGHPIGKYGDDFVDSRSLLTFLNSEKVGNLYDRMTCYPSVECVQCDWYNYCGGGCPLKWTVYKPDCFVKSMYEKKEVMKKWMKSSISYVLPT